MLSYSTPFHSLKQGWTANEFILVGGQHRILSWVGWHPEKFVWKCDKKSLIVSPSSTLSFLERKLPKNQGAHDDTKTDRNLCCFQITFGYQGQWAGPKTGKSPFPPMKPLCKLSATGFKIKWAHNVAQFCFIFNALSCVTFASCSSVEFQVSNSSAGVERKSNQHSFQCVQIGFICDFTLNVNFSLLILRLGLDWKSFHNCFNSDFSILSNPWLWYSSQRKRFRYAS